MTTANLNGLTVDELVDHRVTWLKTLCSGQPLSEEYFRLFVPMLRFVKALSVSEVADEDR